MTTVFVIRNQLGHYWGKKKCWVDGRDTRAVLRVKHQDQAINTLVELGSKNFELRGEVVTAELNPRGEPLIEASETPLPVIVEAEAEAENDQPLAAQDVATNGAAEVATTP